jgi:hypothetical protein
MEVHTFINGLEARRGTCLYGRWMYEVMAAWENDEVIRGGPDYMQDFAQIWRAEKKGRLLGIHGTRLNITNATGVEFQC